MLWGVCISMSRMCVMYICLVFNCFVCFGVYCAKSAIHEIISESQTNSSLSKYKKETCFGNLKWITFSVE